MKKNQTSLSAMGIALSRALESDRPEDERILFDPYARKMIPAWFYWMGKILQATGYAEMRGPGVMAFLALRDRAIDDILLREIAGGIQQLVILGAGLDARAYRFAVLQGPVCTFEVDHPATQQNKVACLKSIFKSLPPSITYVAVDFETQSLEQRLLESGYNPALKTVFIWQGVIYYLEQAAADLTFSFITRHAPPGSCLVFDYLEESSLQTEQQNEIKNMRRYRKMTGEPLKLGIPDGQIEAFLQARGFTDIHWQSSEDLKKVYFTGKNSQRNVAGGYFIATARVAP